MSKTVLKILTAIAVTAALGGCQVGDRLAQVGKAPAFSPIHNIQDEPNDQPISLPMPAPVPDSHSANSLWRAGARSFIKDQRAANVGDGEHARSATEVEDAGKGAPARQAVDRQKAAERGCMMRGAEGLARVYQDGVGAPGYARAVVRTVDREAAGLDWR